MTNFNSEAAFDAMRQWKNGEFTEWQTGVNQRLEALIGLQLTVAKEADAVLSEVLDLEEQQDALSSQMFKTETELAEVRRDIAGRKDELDYLQAQATLEAEGGNQKARDANALKLLNENSEYRAQRNGLQDAERLKMLKEAELNGFEREYKQARTKLYLLRSRLELVTARLKGE